MTSPFHQYQSQVPSLRRPAGVPLLPLLSATYSGAVSSCTPQLLGHRDPIASRALSFPRKLALQSLLAHVHSQPFKHVCNYLSDGLHHFSLAPFQAVFICWFNKCQQARTNNWESRTSRERMK